MSKKNAHSQKYLEVLIKFGLAPDIKLDDFEKSVVKYIGLDGDKLITDLSLEFDLRPSDITAIINKLLKKGLVEINENSSVKLSAIGVRYLNSSKKERKSEKKFRKFLNCLNEEDLDKFLGLVNSFVVSDATPENVIKLAKEIKDVSKLEKPAVSNTKTTKTRKPAVKEEK